MQCLPDDGFDNTVRGSALPCQTAEGVHTSGLLDIYLLGYFGSGF